MPSIWLPPPPGRLTCPVTLPHLLSARSSRYASVQCRRIEAGKKSSAVAAQMPEKINMLTSMMNQAAGMNFSIVIPVRE